VAIPLEVLYLDHSQVHVVSREIVLWLTL